ncbi:MAG: acetyltransferase [Lentimicrobiaceae bacterium]|nr:acetyltransferase [Lentimicrobiaceae bacterium]
MYLYGASGHAKVIIDILTAQGVGVHGLFDDNETIKELLSYPVLRTDRVISPLIISVGDNKTRKKIAESLEVEYGKAVHPSAIVSEHSSIGEGTVVMQNVVIQSSCQIGKHCIINTSASVDHDCIVKDYVHISPNSALCGNVTLGEGTWIGAGSTIIPGVTIGKWCIIGAGSVVTKNIPDFSLAVGNRCEILKSLKKE